MNGPQNKLSKEASFCKTQGGIYFDNAATSYPKPECVFMAVKSYFEDIGANAGRASHRRAHDASKLVFEAREVVAELINVRDSSRIVFTQGATESINLAIFGLRLNEEDHIITSSIEHNSVMRPLRYLEKEKKIMIDIIKCDRSGQLNPSDVESKITKKTKLIIINHASNAIGTILSIKEIGKIARRNNIPFLVDAAQTIGCLPINVEQDNIDLLAFSGHKGLLGPQGIGCLYIGEGIELNPLKFGGTGSHSQFEVQPDFLPDKYESGTLNLPGIAGLKAGIGFILEKGIRNVQTEMQNLTGELIGKLSKIENVITYGPKDEKLQIGVVSINIKGKDPSHIGDFLDKKYDIAVRVGLHCSPQTHKTIGTFPKGTVRISLGLFSTTAHVDRLCDALCQITT